jgi:hypothetical protein
VGRRNRDRDFDRAEAIAKLVLALLLLVALAIGGFTGFASAFAALVGGILGLAVLTAGVGIAALIAFKLFGIWRGRNAAQRVSGTTINGPGHVHASAQRSTASFPTVGSPSWTMRSVEKTLSEIDWYQFEKYCAALLQAEGLRVERKGGAQPDGGVDLIAERGGERTLVQCKHWRTWVIQEKVVREMLGSMTYFQVVRGAIYTLKGWTKPAANFASAHDITLIDGAELARRGKERLTSSQLGRLLNSRERHCPKCESTMIWRQGNFTPFWGCSAFPRCRGKLYHAGAR